MTTPDTHMLSCEEVHVGHQQSVHVLCEEHAVIQLAAVSSGQAQLAVAYLLHRVLID